MLNCIILTTYSSHHYSMWNFAYTFILNNLFNLTCFFIYGNLILHCCLAPFDNIPLLGLFARLFVWPLWVFLVCNIPSPLHLPKGSKHIHPIPTPNVKGTLITLSSLPYITKGSYIICWRDKHIRETHWIVNIICRDILKPKGFSIVGMCSVILY